MTTCRLCKTERVSQLLDFGMQPICSRYLTDPKKTEFQHPMILGQCPLCGLVQMMDPIPVTELVPRYEWIRYVEPEGHLDRLANLVSQLPGLGSSSTFSGMSYKDDSFIRRMQERGFQTGCQGQADVVIARHILEHQQDLNGFLNRLKELANRNGYAVIEVPDCSVAFERDNYTTLWEEHLFYFTLETFRHLFSLSGFSLVRYERYPYPLEDSLVAVIQLIEKVPPRYPSASVLAKEKERAECFARNFGEEKKKFNRIVEPYRAQGGKVALLGAGHLSCAFINLMELQKQIDFVLDGDPNKQGLFMPGSRLPIRPMSALLEEGVTLCLLGVNPTTQEAVIQKNQEFLNRGGQFLSIFPSYRTQTGIVVKEGGVLCR